MFYHSNIVLCVFTTYWLDVFICKRVLCVLFFCPYTVAKMNFKRWILSSFHVIQQYSCVSFHRCISSCKLILPVCDKRSPTLVPGTHWLALRPCDFASPRMSNKWDRSVPSLLLPAPSTRRDAPTLTPLDARISCSPLVISDCTWLYHGVFMHLPAEGHFSYFQFGAIMTNAVVNVCVHVFVWAWVFIPLDKSPEIRFWVMCKLCVCNCKEPPSCWSE